MAAPYENAGLPVVYGPHGEKYTLPAYWAGRTNQLQQDPQTGRPYVIDARGQKQYLPTYETEQQAHDQDNVFRSYTFDPTTGGTKGSTNWGNIVGLGALGVDAAVTAPALIGGGAAASGSSGAIPTTFDAAPAWAAGGYANAADLGATAAGGFAGAPALGSTATGVVAGNGAGGIGAGSAPSILRKLQSSVTDPRNIAGLAALAPMFTSLGGGNSGLPGGDALNNEITQSLALQRQRVQQAQPVYDTLVNMAYGMTPSGYRGAAPQGYAAPATADSYTYQPPRFG